MFRIYRKSFLRFLTRSVWNDYQREVMSRTTEVMELERSSEIINDLIRRGDPIGVDIEGIQDPEIVPIVQIRDSRKNIYLFRTGVNPEILDCSIRKIFEHPEILKIVHAGTNDVMAVYRRGIRLWGLYDTAVAHKVFDYQVRGISINRARTIGFNNLCEYHGLETNPDKSHIGRVIWKTLSNVEDYGFKKPQPLHPDIACYCACDVDPLIDLFYIMDSLIDPEFKIILRDFVDSELYRCVDPDLIRRFRARMSNSDRNNVFLSNLPEQCRNPSYLYSTIAFPSSSFSSSPKVYFSPTYKTAHIIFENRENAVNFAENKFKDYELFKESSVTLLETSLDETKQNKFISNHQRLVSDPKTVTEIIDIILHVNPPIAIDFHDSPSASFFYVDVFVIDYPIFRVPLTDQTVHVLGRLFQSKSIPKIAMRINTREYAKFAKSLQRHGYEIREVFDLSLSAKMLDYWYFGLDLFTRPIISEREFFKQFALENVTRTTKPENMLYIYQHLHSKLLTEKLMNLLRAWIQIESEIIYWMESDRLSAVREARKRLKTKLISNSIYVKNENDETDLESRIRSSSVMNDVRDSIIGRHAAILEFDSQNSAQTALDRLVLDVSGILARKFNNDKSGEKINDSMDVEKIKLSLNDWSENLHSRGFFKLIRDNPPNDVKDNASFLQIQ